ncbi:hypothetical protein ABPG74_002759 [Tetrahymena malaccensis]
MKLYNQKTQPFYDNNCVILTESNQFSEFFDNKLFFVNQNKTLEGAQQDISQAYSEVVNSKHFSIGKAQNYEHLFPLAYYQSSQQQNELKVQLKIHKTVHQKQGNIRGGRDPYWVYKIDFSDIGHFEKPRVVPLINSEKCINFTLCIYHHLSKVPALSLNLEKEGQFDGFQKTC